MMAVQQKLYAASRIDFGALDKDGRNVVKTFETGDAVIGLPDDVVEALIKSGAVGVLAAPEVKPIDASS